jgi:hypothetical protein
MSSKMTFFYKRIFPVIWFGFLAAFFVIGLVKGSATDPISNLPSLIVPVVMAIIGYQIMKRMSFNLVDEVFDLGDALLVRNGGREERIALADIKNVNFFPYMSPPQVTLSLRRPSGRPIRRAKTVWTIQSSRCSGTIRCPVTACH